jgi:hypothetical protein
MRESFGILILFNLYLSIPLGDAKSHYIQVHFLYAFITKETKSLHALISCQRKTELLCIAVL